MFPKKYIVITALLLCASASAKEVTPEEKLGELEVQTIDLSKISPGFEMKKFSMSFEVEKKSKILEFGQANTVAAGTGCLTVQYKDDRGTNVYEASQCDIKVEEKKRTLVQLAAVKYIWNPDQYEVQFGAQPRFYFIAVGDKSYFRLTTGIDNQTPLPEQPVFLIPPMTLQAKLYHIHTGTLFTKNSTLKAGSTVTEKLDTKELRGTLLLDFIDGKPKYPYSTAKNHLHAAYWKIERDASYSHVPERNSDVYNFYEFANDGILQSVRAFPLAAKTNGALYEVSINEHVLKPVLEAGKTTRIAVATLNVNDYRSNIPGTFKVFSSNNQKGAELREHLHPLLRPSRAPELIETLFPTRTSLFFPIGYMFRLDFYIVDDLGRNALQDQIKVDLTTENSPNLY